MAMKIRLARGGSKKRPHYSIVAADSRAARDGRFLEKLGTYDPLLPKDNENRVKMDVERIRYWLGHGAQVTDRVQRFLEAAGVVEKKARVEPEAGPAGQGRRRPCQGARRQGRDRHRRVPGRVRRGPMAGPWIAVISADHAAAAARDGFFACSHGDGRAAARPSLGDRFAYYAPRERYGEGEPVQAFVALGRILDEGPSPRTIGSFEAQVRRADYEPVGRAPVRPLLPALDFLRDERQPLGDGVPARALRRVGAGFHDHRAGAARWLSRPG